MKLIEDFQCRVQTLQLHVVVTLIIGPHTQTTSGGTFRVFQSEGRTIFIPRLELQAAVLATRLNTVQWSVDAHSGPTLRRCCIGSATPNGDSSNAAWIIPPGTGRRIVMREEHGLTSGERAYAEQTLIQLEQREAFAEEAQRGTVSKIIQLSGHRIWTKTGLCVPVGGSTQRRAYRMVLAAW